MQIKIKPLIGKVKYAPKEALGMRVGVPLVKVTLVRDIKSAAEWLKYRILQAHEWPKSMTDLINIHIDEAFDDVVNETDPQVMRGEEDTIEEVERRLYKLNAVISRAYIARQRSMDPDELTKVNLEIGRLIKELRKINGRS